MFKVVTFGSATLDVFVPYNNRLEIIQKQNKKSPFLSLGKKLEGVDIKFYPGGGGFNGAANFKSQGLEVAYCGTIGQDFAGQFVQNELNRLGINTDFVFKVDERTNCSVIFTGKEGKSILPYRGASKFLKFKDIPLEKIKSAEWFYLAPLSGELTEDFIKIIDFAKENNIKVFLNPSKQQLSSSVIEEAIGKVDVLMLNQEESSFLTKIDFAKEREIFEKIDNLTKGIFIMTQGAKGSLASDGNFLYRAPILEAEIIDETGTGDSFGSGFVSEYMKSNNIELALQFAMANSAANLEEMGAKEGILKEGDNWEKVEIKKEKISS
jgi:sugar/nucleoside kinase (ribokinase family)